MRTAGPPADIAPERLFRLLLQTPRPIANIAWQSAGLRVQALTSLEEAACHDGAQEITEPSVRSSWIARGLIAAAVLMPEGGPAFLNADAVGRLKGYDVDALAVDVRGALGRISPSYLRSDICAWMDVVRIGAKHWTNMATVHALGACVDTLLGYGVRCTTERPDRYFGLPIHLLTDGHWMAYRSARLLTVETQNRS